MRDKKFKFIKILHLLVIGLFLFQIGQAFFSSFCHKRQEEELRRTLKAEIPQESQISLESEMTEIGIPAYEEKESKEMIQFSELYAKNNDLVGWITIEGTRIDNPVMQCKDDYYLNHNFYGKQDRYGCLYVKEIADVETPGTNIIIYGHNMRDGSMFGDLDQYKSKSFYKDHSNIYFQTLSEERVYEIVAVFQTQISEEDGVFQYYQFYQAETEEEFLYFYENIKELAMYDTGVTAEYGDTFLTLSTCDYITDDARFVVVAKRIEE